MIGIHYESLISDDYSNDMGVLMMCSLKRLEIGIQERMGAYSDGTISKHRSQAASVSHMSPVTRPRVL